MQTKGAYFIDLGGETPEQSPTITPSDHSPQHSPFPQPDFEISPRKATPKIDPTQQQMYDFIESLENTATEQGTSSNQLDTAQEILIQSLKQEVFELEVLNRHIKRENETLKEHNRLDKIIHDNTMLHLGLWHKKNRKLKKKNRRLSRALINLKYRCLMMKPRMTVTPRKKKRRLDVLAEVSEQMN